jgi:circadian clock protein KaiC
MNNETKYNRVPTGIEGLDNLIQGGFIPGSTIMLAGRSGTGKTLFGAQFIYTGAKVYGERGLYVTFEQRPEDIIADVKETFGWDLKELVESNLIKFLPIKVRTIYDPATKKRVMNTTVFDITQKILHAIEEFKVKRVVIDPATAIEIMFSEEPKYVIRTELSLLSERLRESHVTALLIAETGAEYLASPRKSEYIGFIVDAIIYLDFVQVAEEFKRTLTIIKMRRTNHSTYINPFFIKRGGIVVVEKIEQIR